MLIYKISNNINDKVYIGQTSKDDLLSRISTHKKCVKIEKRRTNQLYKDMYEYGFDNFIFEIIDRADCQDELDRLERYWIKYYNSTNPEFGYNSDSGGLKGGTKSKETRRKIGDTTIAKWKDPEISKKMLDGLLKGVQTCKEKAENNFVEMKCKYCEKIFYLKPYESKNRKYCSLECANNDLKSSMKDKAHIAAILAREDNINRKEIVKKDIIDWVINNREIIKNCPKNKITTVLKPMTDIIFEKYNIKDIRSLFICFSVKNRKDFLIELQKL